MPSVPAPLHPENCPSKWDGWEKLNPVVRFANHYVAPAGEGFGPRFVQKFQLLYVCSGLGTLAVDGQVQRIGAGDLVFYGPGENHQVLALPDGALRLIGIVFLFRREDEHCLDEALPHASSTPFPYPRGAPLCPLNPRPPTLLRAKIGTPRSGRSRGHLRRYCEALAALYSEYQLQRPMEAQGLLWLLLQSWQDDLLQNVGTATLTPRQAIEEQRLRTAHGLLREGGLNVNEAGRAVGFEDPFYFSRRFKLKFGIAPSQVRRDGTI